MKTKTTTGVTKTIRRQILQYLVTGAAILFLMLFIISALELNRMPTVIKNQYGEIANARADEISKELKGFVEQITIISKSPVIKSMDLQKIKEYLPELVLQGKYRNLTIIYPDGEAWSTLPDQFNVKGQEQYRKIFMEDKDYIISQPFFSEFTPETDLPVITVSHSVKKGKETVGIVNMLMNVGFLDKVLQGMDLDYGAVGWIINQRGDVVGHPDSKLTGRANIRGYIQDENVINKILTSESGIIEYKSPGADKMLAFYSEIEDSPGWTFIISLSKDAIYKDIDRVKNTILYAIILSLILLVVFVNYYSKKISRPILELKDKFEKAANGNLNIKANEDMDNELGQAAKSFNIMLEKIKNLTYEDRVTRMYNYNGFTHELLAKAIDSDHNDAMAAITIISIDDFKRINSIYGFEFGDEVLLDFAHRLKGFLEDGEIAARFLGDEFILFTTGDDVDEIKNRIYDLWYMCCEEIKISNNQIIMRVSVGTSIFFYNVDYTTEGIYQANIAKLIVKREGGDGVRFYDYELEKEIKEEQDIEDALYHAIENRELRLVYQPIVELSTNKIVKAEALLRWTNPMFSHIPIPVIIRIAEQNGLITEIGKWVLEEACRQNKSWQMGGYPHIKVSVNVSVIQYEQTNFVENVEGILERTGLDPTYLELEITESIGMDGGDENLDKMRKLKEIGISISVDDFGTGYSSLAYFTRFPIDTLKIDRSFINNMLFDTNAKTLIATIVNMAKAMKIYTVAEGVETVEQMEYLRENSCDQIQGYLISGPVVPGLLTEMLTEERGNLITR